MSETEVVDAAPSEEQQEQQQPPQLSSPSSAPDDPQPAAHPEPPEERATEDAAARPEPTKVPPTIEYGAARVQYGALSGETSVDQFRMKKFFVLRVKT